MRDLESRHFHLDAGVLTLETDRRQEDLFRIAERINPRRAFLFVSTVLGRHIPVDPLVHRKALQALSRAVSDHLGSGPVLVMGFAETAIGLGAGVHDCLVDLHSCRQIGFLPTTRFAQNEDSKWFEIQEAHSHAVDHIILRPAPGVLPEGERATLVLVDDETTSGATFAALAKGLKREGMVFDHVVLATLTDWSDGRAMSAVEQVFPEAQVNTVSLQQGRWQWSPGASAARKSLPGPLRPERAPWSPGCSDPFATPRFGYEGRNGHADGEALLAELLRNGLEPVGIQDRVLLIGAGENVWAPMLVAEALSVRRIFTRFITTTRSPIEPGDVIRQKVVFPDHYGGGFEMYMHNVVAAEWNRILLFNETGQEGIPNALSQALDRFDLIGPNGSVTTFKEEEVFA